MSESLDFSTVSDRLPPQNIDAEESILGGILLDPEAMNRVAEILTPEAFYLSAHRTIFEAMRELHARGNPTDLLSVTTWLKDRDLLEKVGGSQKISQLLDRTVSAVNIDRYALLIADKYVRRQLISVGGDIAQLAFDNREELAKLLDRAEQRLFNITQSKAKNDLTSAEVILSEAFFELESRALESQMPGLSSGFYDLDAMTQGFQRSDLIIVAGRPSMGKTSFVMNAARNVAAIHNLPIAIFSLEMSKEQLMYRMLSSEAQIESNRLRSGRISENEWGRIGSAIQGLSNLKLYIDDTADISITEMRSKARRLQAERGGALGLIVIDYLQLMEGGGDNRVQELSKITRSLKALARELNVPILALSQLSRSVESRTNKRPMMSDLRESGCLTGDTLVFMADSGQRVPIRQLVGRKNFSVLALNPITWKLESKRVSHAFSTGIKPVFRLTTRLGRQIRATANHQFLTLDGWLRLDCLQQRMRIALPRQLAPNQTTTITQPEVALMGHLIGDGCTLPRHAIQYKTVDLDLATAVQELAVQVFGDDIQVRIKPERNWQQNLSRERLNRIAEVLDLSSLKNLANSDVYWDEVVSIEPDGEEEVFDLTVPEHHNFVANNIIVHNSIEQDADLILMLYREEYYNPDTPDRGIAEVLLTKHRNGPTGTVRLLFDSQFTQFKNMAGGGGGRFQP